MSHLWLYQKYEETDERYEVETSIAVRRDIY